MYQWTSVGYTTFTRPLELAFSNGYGPQGERIGPQTGELTEMTSYNDFEAAVKQQLAAITAKNPPHSSFRSCTDSMPQNRLFPA